MKRTPPGLIAFILLACVLRANAAVPVNVLDVDLAPLIDQSAPHPERFAVNVPHAASTVTQGAWQTNGRTRIWTYAVRIPGAVSVSFHAPLARLPASARLTVGGRDATVVYRAADINRATLWGRPLVGDTLTFQLTVDATEAAAVRIDLDSLQAGYRGLSANVPDHPYYKSRFVAEAAAAAATCTQNYSCNATDANRGPAKATVAILIGNLWQCTGTLVNDTAGDLRPYVLTARHCETGEIGGGAPQAAAQVSIYWDAVAPCGGILPSLYSAASKIQSGAHTVVEQQDAWLIELDQPPVIDDPYYAGWDATGGVFTGGYSVHHALGGAKQYTGWNGQALLQHIAGPVLKAPYDSDFWGLVNSVGNVGAGASGGALFDPQNRVVGSASLAWIDNTGDGRCPVANPPAPTAASITAQYTAFSAVWASTRDASSTTGNATMQSVLDAGATGRLTVDGLTVSPMTFTASNTSPNTDGAPVTLTWDASWAQSCTATGGRTGDGWAGAKPGSGSAQVTDSTGGSIRYALTCSGPGHSGSAAVTVNWNFVPASVSLTGPIAKVMVGGTFTLNWNSNVQPCTASDGNSGDGWAGAKSQNGSQTLAADHLGVTTYTVTCGTGQRTGTSQVNVEVVSPAVTLHTDATRIRIDSDFNIWWTSPATDGRCDGSGGTPGWAQNTVLV